MHPYSQKKPQTHPTLETSLITSGHHEIFQLPAAQTLWHCTHIPCHPSYLLCISHDNLAYLPSTSFFATREFHITAFTKPLSHYIVMAWGNQNMDSNNWKYLIVIQWKVILIHTGVPDGSVVKARVSETWTVNDLEVMGSNPGRVIKYTTGTGTRFLTHLINLAR